MTSLIRASALGRPYAYLMERVMGTELCGLWLDVRGRRCVRVTCLYVHLCQKSGICTTEARSRTLRPRYLL
jgi:hypothetical protein